MSSEYSLVFPFVCTKSRGGPYDDAAFVAGCQFGQISAELGIAKTIGALPRTVTIYREMAAQCDLLAMHLGLTVAEQPIPDEDGVDPADMDAVRSDWAVLVFDFAPVEPPAGAA